MTGCDGHRDQRTYERTVLVYMVAENSLSYGDYHEQDLKEMEAAVGQMPSDSRLVVYVDDTLYPRLFVFESHADSTVHRRVLREWSKDVNSASKETLASVIGTVTDEFPAKHYGFLFWSHGDGWLPAQRAPQRRSIGIDNGYNTYANSGNRMEIADLASALKAFPSLDFVMFDACFMQTVEVAYELRNVCRYLIASPTEIPLPGAPYDQLVPVLFLEPANPMAIADAYRDYYRDNEISVLGTQYRYGVVLSVVDCAHMQDLTLVCRRLLDRYPQPYADGTFGDAFPYYPLSSSMVPPFYDMKAAMHSLLTDEDQARFLAAFNLAVPYISSNAVYYCADLGRSVDVPAEGIGGISAYYPIDSDYYRRLNGWFQNTSWYKDVYCSTLDDGESTLSDEYSRLDD